MGHNLKNSLITMSSKKKGIDREVRCIYNFIIRTPKFKKMMSYLEKMKTV
jgi:hypothetical protein